METAFPTTQLLKPERASAAQEEIKTLEAKLHNPKIEDKGEVSRQLRRAKRDFETQVPRAPETPIEEDRMVKRSRELLSEITRGMPSQEEMRKAPPGAVDKHLAWEKRNKPRIMEWKHIMRRLTAGSGENDSANLEKYRPVASTLSMDNAQIPGKQIFLPDNPDGLGVTFSDAQLALLRSLDPGLADRIGSLKNSQRAQVKDILRSAEGIGLEAPSKASLDGKRGVEKRERMKREMSAEQKEKQRAGLEKARAAAKAKREARKANPEAGKE